MPDLPPYVLVPAVGVALLLSFFGMRYIRRAFHRQPASKQSAGSPSPVLPFMPDVSISERVILASRASEIEAEELLLKQERLLELEARKSQVSEVMSQAGITAAKNS